MQERWMIPSAGMFAAGLALPRCSSGEILVSEGSGQWRHATPERR